MPARRGFPKWALSALAEGRMLGIRAGEEHRFTGIWVVVVAGRVYVRPWNDKPTGWHRAFEEESVGTISIQGREIRIRARPVRSERIHDAVDAAYAEKYHTPGSRKWVRGFSQARRRATTTELVPR
jgi:hypothetical protein